MPITVPPNEIPSAPLTGDELIAKIEEIQKVIGDVTKTELALRCGYIKGEYEDGGLIPDFVNLFSNIMQAKGIENTDDA